MRNIVKIKEHLLSSCSIIRFHRCCDHLGVSLIGLCIHEDNNNGNLWKQQDDKWKDSHSFAKSVNFHKKEINLIKKILHKKGIEHGM